MEADKIVGWCDAGDTEAKAARNLALAVEQNCGMNARSLPMCVGISLPRLCALASP